MDKAYYLKKLGLTPPSTMEDVRRAYRIKARQLHPDINNSPGATDLFIEATEAYEYLTRYFKLLSTESDVNSDIRKEWVKYRQQQARERARAYAGSRYSNFKTSGYYKSSAPSGVPRIIYNLIISVFIIFAAIYGYIDRLRLVDEGFDEPTLSGFLGLLLIGIIFLSISLIYLIAHYQIKKARRSIRNEKN